MSQQEINDALRAHAAKTYGAIPMPPAKIDAIAARLRARRIECLARRCKPR
jgi:hypothetical protein